MSDWFEKISLGDMLDRCAARFGAREAFCFAGEHWSFDALRADVNRAARALLHSDVQVGDKVALWLSNRPEWLHIWLAAARCRNSNCARCVLRH